MESVTHLTKQYFAYKLKLVADFTPSNRQINVQFSYWHVAFCKGYFGCYRCVIMYNIMYEFACTSSLFIEEIIYREEQKYYFK